jgi:serine/threonine protein phosphatase PrpC
MPLRMYGDTDKGLVRKTNQDAFFFNKEYGIVIVSDGMGGHKGGEIASQLVVDGLRDAYMASSQILFENVGSFLDDVLKTINAEILRQSEADERLSGMGATVNYLQFAGGMVAIGHAGDSRTYLVRKTHASSNQKHCAMWQLTVDHNVGTFLERGILKSSQFATPPSERHKARLTRGMGVTRNLSADLYTRTLVDGDVYLTCSDGLHGYVTEEAILDTLCEGPISEAPTRLINLAKSMGAPDNVTVVISVWGEQEEPLRDPVSEDKIHAPFLIRLPEGILDGPLDSKQIIQRWTLGHIPLESEISGHGRNWVFLHKWKNIYLTYPEFDCAPVREYLSRMGPASSAAPSVIKGARGTITSRLRKPATFWWLAGGSLVLFGIIVFWSTLAEFVSLRDNTW